MTGKLDSVKTKAKEVAVEDFNKAKALAEQAAKSRAYLYPIKGIFYFASHSTLWKPLISKLVPTMTLSVGVIAFMFIFAYLPQLSILVLFNGPVAVLTTVLLTLSESSTIITLLSRNFLIHDALVDTFDGVLVARNQTSVVSEGRELRSGNFNDPIAKLGKLIKSPFEKFTPKALIRYVMYLPLNFIPLVGTVLFVVLQGKTRGLSAHTRYFQLKKWSNSKREQWLQENTAPYTAFGTVATLLELIPVASIFFSFTNTVGAALWAADIENNNTSMTEMQTPKGGKDVKKSE
ncbi:Uncharacterized protein BP5553_06564 [Venustampulla echinocandica]|uniref:Outer spore wall protein RRT8 n=1 Tax=Venustampulla echinocandica TaxID=2656787 RepID=A0A370TKA2_9HELO|nr:Uncharacterized protein BP5553_06564 [Venustampulla echinocandica]RDL35952.1 Uncharacterized protein BP5553_06564 [Venustampulla echinocandica]